MILFSYMNHGHTRNLILTLTDINVSIFTGNFKTDEQIGAVAASCCILKPVFVLMVLR